MSLVDTYAPFLPYLRRFSRALTGSQKSGDQYVRTALEALVAGDAAIDDQLPPKTALYRMFLGIWGTTGAQLEDEAEGSATPADRIRRLTPVSRQAFLLSALEGLSVEEIAQVMDVDEARARDLLSEAEADIEKELRTNVLIIEDEPIIAADIEELVRDLGHTVDGIAATHSDAVAMAKQKEPGIVLADIQLADGSSGIDAVDDILGEYNVPVIFITAFPERLLTGDKPEPAFLISKPYTEEQVRSSVSQAMFFSSTETLHAQA